MSTGVIRILGAVALIAVIAAATFILVRGVGGSDRAEIEIVVRDYILEHPEIIPQAIDRLQTRESEKRIAAIRDELEQPFAGAWAGAENPDVIVVEFFDYACGYCRQSLPDIVRLIEEDEGVRFVFRELPILSPDSEAAARMSLAAARQADFFAFHRAMYDAGRPGEATIAEASRAAGLDQARARRDAAAPEIASEIASNLALAGQLQLNGTPAFVVGDQLLSGAVGYERLKEAIAETRAAGSS